MYSSGFRYPRTNRAEAGIRVPLFRIATGYDIYSVSVTVRRNKYRLVIFLVREMKTKGLRKVNSFSHSAGKWQKAPGL